MTTRDDDILHQLGFDDLPVSAPVPTTAQVVDHRARFVNNALDTAQIALLSPTGWAAIGPYWEWVGFDHHLLPEGLTCPVVDTRGVPGGHLRGVLRIYAGAPGPIQNVDALVLALVNIGCRVVRGWEKSSTLPTTPLQDPATCPHLHTETVEDGALYFSGGELVDTRHEALLCLDCFTEIPPADLKAKHPAKAPDGAGQKSQDIPF